MKPLFPVLGAAWLLTLGAAFLVGQKSSPDSAPDADAPGSRSAARTSSVASKSARDSAQPSPDHRATDRRLPRGEAGRILARTSPRQAVVELAQLSDPIERAEGFLALIAQLGPDEFRDVVADFRALGITEQRMSEYGMLLHAWGQTDPVGALDYAMEKTGSPFARQTILASWSARDPEAAIAFANEHHEGEGANPLMVGVIRGIAPRDLNRATDLLQGLPYSQERGDALQSMLPFVMENGVDVALTWSNGIADGQLKSGALSYIMNDLSNRQPEIAAQVLVTLDDNNAALRVADDVAGSFARVDLAQAITWSQSLQDDVRAEAIEGIVGPYAAQDPQAASQWLDSLEGTTNIDPAIRSFAWTTQRQDPQLAAEWIGRIQNEGQRNEMYRNVLSRWWSADPAAAEQWIQSNPTLPANVQELPGQLQQRRDAGARGGRAQTR